MDKSVDTTNKENNKPVQDVNEQKAVAAAPNVQTKEQPESHLETKKKRTVGNKIYDFGVFGSVAFAGVSAMSAISAHEANYGTNKYFDWFRKLNDKLTDGVYKLTSKLMKNSPEAFKRGMARNMALVFSCGSGGSLLMPLIKWMEDHRLSNAAKIDKMLGTTPPDAESVEHEPKQSWKSVFAGRGVSWGSSFVVTAALGPKIVSKVNNYFGEKGAETWMKMKPQSNPQKVRKWSDIIVFDSLSTIVTAAVLFVFSRFVAKRDEQKHGSGDTLYEINIDAPNPFGDEEPKKEQKKFADSVQSTKSKNKELSEPPSDFVAQVKQHSEPAYVGV